MMVTSAIVSVVMGVKAITWWSILLPEVRAAFTPSSFVTRRSQTALDPHFLRLAPHRISRTSFRKHGLSLITLFTTNEPNDSLKEEKKETYELEKGKVNTTSSQAVQEAEELRNRAKQLMAEANAEEAALRESRSTQTKQRRTESDAMIDHLFEGNSTTDLLADKLRSERWSEEQLASVIDRLYERQTLALGRSSPSPDTNAFQIGDVRNSAVTNETEYELLEGFLDQLLLAVEILDEEYSQKRGRTDNTRWTGRVGPALKTRLKELRRVDEESFKRRLAAELNAAVRSTGSDSPQDVMGYMRRTLGQSEKADKKVFNMTKALEQVAMIPMWVPSSLLPFVVIARTKLDPDDVKAIRDDVLLGTPFYCTTWDSIPTAAVYRGNFRTPSGTVSTIPAERNYTAVVFEEIQQRLAQAGLAERIQLFLLNDPEWRPGRDEREPKPKPIILALSKEVAPEQGTERDTAAKVIAGVSVGLTILTTLAYAISCYSLNPIFFESVINQNDYTALAACIPIFAGVFALQAIHELAHFVVAKMSRIKIGLPVPLPSLQLGSFGCITPLRSFPSSRSALFDFALSGPVATMILSVLLMTGGVFATVYASTTALSNFPVLPVALLKSSFFTGSLLSVLAPKIMTLPLSQPVPIHPLFVVGFTGLISSALNLLPIGRLDGGRVYTAVCGSRSALLITFVTLLFLAFLAITGSSTISIFWGALVVLCQRQPEIPVRNEVTEIDDVRMGAYVLSLLLALLALAPFPGGPGYL